MNYCKGLVWLGALLLLLGPAAPARASSTSSWAVALAEDRVEMTYTVHSGDTLSGIAARFGVDLGDLMTANRLTGALIHPNDLLLIPGHYEPVPAFLSRGDVDRSDLMLLSRLIYAEARGEPFNGQVAVGAVIMNRVASPQFPKTIRGVIMQHIGRDYQFQPVADGAIDTGPDACSVRAAISALNGRDPSHGALFFYNPSQVRDQWILSLPVITRIGNHVFATDRTAAGHTFLPDEMLAGVYV